MRKEFDQELFNQNDPETRNKVANKLKAMGYMVTENSYKYGQDLLASFYVEVERRPSWEGQEFPYDTVHIPERKRKFLHCLGMYVVSNKDYTSFMGVDFYDVSRSPVQEVSNKYVGEGEKFFIVPTNKFKILGSSTNDYRRLG